MKYVIWTEKGWFAGYIWRHPGSQPTGYMDVEFRSSMGQILAETDFQAATESLKMRGIYQEPYVLREIE